MKVFSFIDQRQSLLPVEVEVSLTPGLPIIQFLGRADGAIKESEARIRSALLHQGFDLPAAQQVLINLRPNHLKKTSRGLDLAVAAAILWETGQLPKPRTNPLYIYGELSLTGEVLPPDDLSDIDPSTITTPLVTGKKEDLPLKTAQVENLKQLSRPELKAAGARPFQLRRPLLQDLTFPENQAELLKIIATGEHSALLAGPAGTGKTTCAQQVVTLLQEPEPETQKQIQRLWKGLPLPTWRPFRSPHHSTPPISMVGGGTPPQPGEVSRAHGGVLLLDELLEFQAYVLDALREPIEAKTITVSRGGTFHQYPADFLLLATTNLCQCSHFVPGPENRCRCSNRKRREYLQRLSGPLLDRFHIFTIVPPDDNPYVTLKEIRKSVQEARAFAQEQRQQTTPNKYLPLDYFEKNENKLIMNTMMPETGHSRRRKLALLRVARTIADLDKKTQIQPQHLDHSTQLTLHGFIDLEAVKF